MNTNQTPPPRRQTNTSTQPERAEERDFSGVLFYLDSKKTVKHPDVTGRVKINGKMYGLSGWIKRSESGVDYISLSVNAEFFNR